jgi:tetratricopeptide (TPR) repeat protein
MDQQRENRMMVEAFRARLDEKRGKPDAALARLASIYEEAATRPDTARAWVGQVDLILGGDPIRIAQFMESVQPAKDMPPYLKVLLARHLSQNPARWPEALELLSGLESEIDPATDVLSMLDLHRSRAGLFYVSGDYAKSAEEYKRALKLAPDDAEFNNNLAFTLAKHLNGSAEAVPYAERAAARDPENPAILDTLGVLYKETGQLAKADQTLERALKTATSVADRAATMVHLAEVKLALGDRIRAQSLATEAQGLVSTDRVLQDTYGGELESLMRSLDRAE